MPLKRLLTLSLLLFPSTVFAAPAAPAPGIDWLHEFYNNLVNLVTANGGALTQVGLTELSLISMIVLISMVIRWSVTGMTLHFHHQPLRMGDLTMFLLRLVFCCLLETYWNNPLPGTAYGLNHFFSWIALQIVQVIDQNSLNQLLQLFNDMSNGTKSPSNPFDVANVLLFMWVQVEMAICSGIIFLINASALVFYGVAALFGPLFIPFYMASATRQKFFQFVDVLLSLAMIRAVASAFIFVWSGFLTTFIANTFHGDYSLGMWLGHFLAVTAVQAAFILNMFYVPAITSMLFGPAAGATARLSNLAETAALAALAA